MYQHELEPTLGAVCRRSYAVVWRAYSDRCGRGARPAGTSPLPLPRPPLGAPLLRPPLGPAVPPAGRSNHPPKGLV